ncbi:MAG: Spy/CpxP family protein refolding chaperone [Melioribacteraceae bacterium]
MFTKHKKLALIVSLLGTIMLLSLFSSSATAQSMGRCMSGSDAWWSNSNVPAKYQLSPEQITKIREIRSQYDDEIIPLQRELRSLRMEARGYASRSDAEVGKIKSYRKDINNLNDKIEDLRLNAKAEINKVLTKEQRVYFGDNFGWWDMDGGMMGMMGDGMGKHDMCR